MSISDYGNLSFVPLLIEEGARSAKRGGNNPSLRASGSRIGRVNLKSQIRKPRARLVSLPGNVRCVGPQVFQRVVAARVGVENVDHHVAVILDDPAAGFVAFDTEPAFSLGVE